MTGEAQPTESAYSAYLAQRHAGALLRRSADRQAAFVLPHLHRGMRLLDVGCGPGAITVGLAQRLAPGPAVGIDVSEEAIATATALARERGVTNARFEVGDACALPFADATFDAVFAHAVLQHLPDPDAAVREWARVLRAGGVIALADADYSGGFAYPSSDEIARGYEIFSRLRVADGGSPDAGRRLGALLAGAGIVRRELRVVADHDSTPERCAASAAFQADWFEAPAVVARVVALGIAGEAEMREIARAWRTWGTAPGAIWLRLWCQAVGRTT